MHFSTPASQVQTKRTLLTIKKNEMSGDNIDDGGDWDGKYTKKENHAAAAVARSFRELPAASEQALKSIWRIMKFFRFRLFFFFELSFLHA